MSLPFFYECLVLNVLLLPMSSNFTPQTTWGVSPIKCISAQTKKSTSVGYNFSLCQRCSNVLGETFSCCMKMQRKGKQFSHIFHTRLMYINCIRMWSWPSHNSYFRCAIMFDFNQLNRNVRQGIRKYQKSTYWVCKLKSYIISLPLGLIFVVS